MEDSMFHVRYVEGCSPKFRSFATKEEATKFVANFMLKYQFVNVDDNWVDFIIEGRVIYCEPAVEVG